jgi:RimJ/RimL family protein N-acetyltransferase
MAAMGLSDLELLELQVEALFTHDAGGRICFVNEPGGDRAPRFFFGRTREGNLWRVRDDLPEDVARRLEGLAEAEPVHGDLRAEPRQIASFRAVLGVGREVGPAYFGPAYRFPDEIPAPASEATRLTYADLRLLERLGWNIHAEATQFAAREPYLAVISDGAAVSVCFCARITARAAEAGLETLPGYRGRGYGPVVTAAWARAIRESGRIPLYSTSWDNPASRAVAHKLGLVQYGTDLSLG